MNATRYYSKFGHSKQMAEAIEESPVPQMAKALKARGIQVCDKSFTCKGSMGPVYGGHPDAKDLDNLRTFVQSIL